MPDMVEIELLHNRICQALGDPTRIRILYALAERPHYVNELSELLNLPQPTVSRHLQVLRDRQLVITERQNQVIYYRVRDNRIIQALDMMLALMHDLSSIEYLSKGAEL
jgi:ArsR family transcriptional regulator